MQLADEDIRTREVLNWSGLHLFHAPGSSCSQKIRIYLTLKGIAWNSHVIDLKAGENHETRYLGINPRGLVPCLVHDGRVYIESNDIISYLEETFPEPPMMPASMRDKVDDLLQVEDELHIDLRVLTFRYIIPTRPGAMRPAAALQRLQDHEGTIGGEPDPNKVSEIQFWKDANSYGITDQQVADSTARFFSAFEQLDEVLCKSDFVLGNALTVVDVAWYVYTARVITAGYPLQRLHAGVAAWFDRLDSRAEFHNEVDLPTALKDASEALQKKQREQGRSLEAIAGL